jgi:hypothetical protein
MPDHVWFDDESDWDPPNVDTPTVWDDDPNPVIGVIVGPDGEPLVHVRQRTPRPMGFQQPAREA